ncbi:hypothetical protein BU16DRAFT_561793 [Lophium mytilinum]|uniref:chitinase n=1 Tax=Lophium mytilinum TaxID=390894 RepID=A0A6A6QU73_9PEZI|nr:hypothetical protein BU16DRAFT_561793 [Lophium mytilinum]
MRSSSARVGRVSSALLVLTAAGLLLLLFCWPQSKFSTGELPDPPDVVQWSTQLDANNPALANTSHILRRDDYTCGPGKPCSNGACCGPSGYCGYCAAYCGAGCTSNCDAVAECGECSDPAGKTCPLNACCSPFGFCGTTEEFCGKDCQSNCVLHPKPSGSTGRVFDRVIGYYQSWADRLACHKVHPQDLPLTELTHLNLAFASVDPNSFELVPMDSKTPAELFESTVLTKNDNSALKVFISVGGWTFSDNGTATQPVFGNIASSVQNREKFANNVLAFLNGHGFDGIDIDWEYPGAPDRGGRPEDTNNYVLLLQALRNAFDASPRGLGITFTAPSSYWYLRWFDLPGMLKYSDWVNVMTYDLHGVWDRNNPIGSIVQGHTNLTEIGYALELFWRVKIPPSKVLLGFGFYGRSFQLSDPACAKPGCLFSGGADPGPCSATSGILEYYEIKALLSQHSDLKPVYDKSAAVKYVVYNGNQWVSYDDAETFKQKVDWANDLGLGGSLIWASDADDDKYSAHSGLLSRDIKHLEIQTKQFSPNPVNIAQNLIGQNGQDCKLVDVCTDVENPVAAHCGKNRVKIGWERSDCGHGYGKIICCPQDTAPKSCVWRGGTGKAYDCNGQCHVGETLILKNSWGGLPTEEGGNQKKCRRGYKVFCCEAGGWKDLIEGCYWTSCGGSCKSSEDEVSNLYDSTKCTIIHPWYKYCCPRPTSLYDCRWVGSQPDCPDAKCNADEVTIALNGQGRGFPSCGYDRYKANCCKVKTPPKEPTTCHISICDTSPLLCTDEDSEASDELFRRDATLEDGLTVTNKLERRKGRRPFPFHLVGREKPIISFAIPAPRRGDLFRGTRLFIVYPRWFRMTTNRCDDTAVQNEPLNLDSPPSSLPPDMEAEHPVDLQLHSEFVRTANTGQLRSGRPTTTPPIATEFWEGRYFNNAALPNGIPRFVPGGSTSREPAQRVWEAFGTRFNAANFIPTARLINNYKGAVFALNDPMHVDVLRRTTREAMAGNQTSHELLLQTLRGTIGVFNYLNDDAASERFLNVRDDIRNRLVLLEENVPEADGVVAHWDEWFPDYFAMVEIEARAWLSDTIRYIRTTYENSIRAIGPYPAFAEQTFEALYVLEGKIWEECVIKALQPPKEDPPPPEKMLRKG